MTADCLPVLLCNIAGTRVAAVHAGWRGLLAGVLEHTVTRFSDPPGELLAWLGPAIGPRHSRWATRCARRSSPMIRPLPPSFVPMGARALAGRSVRAGEVATGPPGRDCRERGRVLHVQRTAAFLFLPSRRRYRQNGEPDLAAILNEARNPMTDQWHMLTLIGEDKPGIVAAVTQALFDLGLNLGETSMLRLGGNFTIMMMVTGSHPDGFLEDRLKPVIEAQGDVPAHRPRSRPACTSTWCRISR